MADAILRKAEEAGPSMKCREKNPGNCRTWRRLPLARWPSMKCREKNPGNPKVIRLAYYPEPLNEVPGKESRQSRVESGPRLLVPAPQ